VVMVSHPNYAGGVLSAQACSEAALAPASQVPEMQPR